jgi:hypothetical protein
MCPAAIPTCSAVTHEEIGQRLERYVESLAMLEDETAGHPLVEQLRFELEALRALPPRTSAAQSR